MLKHFALLSALAFGFATSACDGSGGQGGTGGGGTGGGGSGGGGSGGVGGTGGGGTGGVGGVGGTGGGGTGGVGGGGAPGCDTAIDVMVPSTVTGTTAGAANLFTGGPTCPFDLGNGGDVLYAVTVPAGKSHLFFKLTPSAGSDPAMYVRTACADESSELDCHDAAAAGGVESLGVGNLQPGQTVYLVVDAYSGAFEGDYTLEVSSPDVEVDCNDLIDNDFDGFPDCQDDNCAMSPDCQGGNVAYGGPCAMQSECQSQNNDPVCLDEAFFGFPNGYCGELCDVLTNDCAGDGLCLDVGLGLGAGTCFDGCVTDGDCLGYHTCIDPTQVDPAQPAGDSICYPFEKACGDGQDNDLDGYPDCQDYDCFQSPVCAADLCATATVATLGDNAGNNLGSTNALAGTCGGDSTFEQLFVYTPPSNQNVTFTVTAATDLLVYVFTDCANASGTQVSGASGCVDGQFGGTPEVLGPLPLVGGTPYYVAVDSYSGTSSGPFTLNLTAN